jgi:copper(I)-binding protein
MNRIKLLTGFAALSLALAVAGCGGEAEAPAPAAPDAPEGVAISEGRLLLPAVAGNPGAVYFTIKNSGANDVMIRSVNVAGAASAMMHQTAEWSGQVDMQELLQVAVPRDSEVVFAPGGMHVMAMELDDTLAVGGETEVTLTFVGGDKASFPAEIRAAGDDS